MDRLSGSVEEIRFRNDENGWTVLVLDSDGDPVTVAGTLPPVTPGDFIELEGEFVIHPKFGTQFKAERASIAAPRSEYGIIRFLGSGLIEGVGEKTAARIVDKFGVDAIEIIEKTPERLSEIRGISPKKAVKIAESFGALRAQREAIMFLAGYGVSVNLALKLYSVYGASTVSTVKSNPYVLVEDVDGVGFLTADKIAQSMGIDPLSDFRMRAGIVHALGSSCEKEGNTYLPKDKLFDEAKKLLVRYDEDGLVRALDSLMIARKVVIPFEGAVMGELYYRTERAAAVKTVRRVDASGIVPVDVNDVIDRFEKTENITLHAAQREAVVNAVTHGASVITGGPGTGKTTIINCILFVLDALSLTATLLAPTGRAAKRITEGCGRDASTIHRAVLMLEDGAKFDANAVIVDEFSMVDIFLYKNLLDHMSDATKLIVVGDADQLPSVGAGNVLRDLIASGLVPVTRLSFIYRQSNTSRIAVSAHEINDGKVPDLTARDGDFFFFRMRSAQEIADMTVQLATTRITGFCGIEPHRIQVIAALKNGVCGVHTLNTRLQAALNAGAKKKVVVGDCTFIEGDRVMHTVNNYELEWSRGSASGVGVFNGDIGIVVHVFDTGEIEVEFEDGRRVLYAGENRRQLILSYAVTVHKSQGCEFDAVVMPVIVGAPVIMTRNLLYTAITRAKKMAVLVGDEYAVKRMVDNNYVAERFSALNVFIDDAKAGMTKLYGDVN
ncbi:MAG: ATP-dependent RecD-like DNA helicase [Clostridiales bacterium]|nr:ATP-dependent RecD-like DNA helicase [Clostridiales bacterium]